MQSFRQIVTTSKPTPNFLQAGCPSYRPANSVKALKGKWNDTTEENTVLFLVCCLLVSQRTITVYWVSLSPF